MKFTLNGFLILSVFLTIKFDQVKSFRLDRHDLILRWLIELCEIKNIRIGN